MSSFVFRDPRGRPVRVRQEALTHIAKRHGGTLPMKAIDCIRSAVTDPDIIIDNPHRPGLDRVADERYIRSLGPEQIVVVPAAVFDADAREPGGVTIVAPFCDVKTAWITDVRPTGAVIWLPPPDEERSKK